MIWSMPISSSVTMSSRLPFSAASFSASFSFIASRRLRVMRSSSSLRSMRSAQDSICSSIIARSKADGTGMKRKAAWVMITASQFAVAARARKRERFAFTKFVSSATRMRAVG